MVMQFKEAYKILKADVIAHPEKYAWGGHGNEGIVVTPTGHDVGDKFMLSVSYDKRITEEVMCADWAFLVDKKTGKISNGSFMTYLDGIGTKYPVVKLD
jgi:hypothetical protein